MNTYTIAHQVVTPNGVTFLPVTGYAGLSFLQASKLASDLRESGNAVVAFNLVAE